MNWAIDYCAQALRHITIGKGGKTDGVEIESGFLITAASEIMAILSIARDLSDFRNRMAEIVVAYDRSGREITTADLEVDGAMCAWMAEAINPNLLQTIEGQPVFVHAGPFANIALGQSSIIADLIGTCLVDYLVTESGYEKSGILNFSPPDSVPARSLSLLPFGRSKLTVEALESAPGCLWTRSIPGSIWACLRRDAPTSPHISMWSRGAGFDPLCA